MRASDIAYICALVEKAPSSYPRRDVLIEELQRIYIEAQGGRHGETYNIPVSPTLVLGSVLRVDRA